MANPDAHGDEVTSEMFYEGCCLKNNDEELKKGPQDGYVISEFRFRYPDDWYASDNSNTTRAVTAVQMDDDGDLVVERRRVPREGVIHIEHSWRTSLQLVGLQVWRGALLLADWALHSCDLLAGTSVLELGAGTGVTSIAAAVAASEVICTDVDLGGILNLIRKNAAMNSSLIRGKFTVLGLDFFQENWSTELNKKLKDVSIVLAADVVYDVDLTEAFVRTVVKILSIKPRKTLYFALEKRYVFTMEDLDSVAPIYEHFLACLNRERQPHWTVEKVPIDFPQYFRYDRVKELVLWRIAS